MKVLHVCRSDAFAGVERHIATLARAQEQMGHQVVVIGGHSAAMSRELAGSRVQVVRGSTLPQVASQIRRYRGAEVVHAHMTAGEFAAACTATAPLVATRHFARRRGSGAAGRLAAVLIRARLSAQIAISHYVADAIDGTSTVIYPGVPRDEEAGGIRRPVVLVVQRLQPEKLTHVALRAFALAAPSGWTMEIVGSGAELSSLHKLAEDLAISDQVSFLGFRNDVAARMRSSSILLAPCEVEGLGLSVVEAMAHGLPVIASRAGAHLETVGRVEGARLYEPGDWRQAAVHLRELIDDQSARDSYGAALRDLQRAEFTPQAQAAATQRVYEEVLG